MHARLALLRTAQYTGNAKNLWDEHWDHWEHLPPLEERIEYPYMNIRSKAYPWGDGDKVS